MTYLLNEYTYEMLKKFQRVKSVREIFHLETGKKVFEDETILKIKENIYNYKKREQNRLRKIEALTRLLDKIEEKSIYHKFHNLNRH